MKFNIELDMDNFSEYFNDGDFASAIKEAIGREILNIYEKGYCAEYNISALAKECVNAHIGEIISLIVKEVSDRLEKKQSIKDMCASNKENKEYIDALINECIAKKFK